MGRPEASMSPRTQQPTPSPTWPLSAGRKDTATLQGKGHLCPLWAMLHLSLTQHPPSGASVPASVPLYSCLTDFHGPRRLEQLRGAECSFLLEDVSVLAEVWGPNLRGEASADSSQGTKKGPAPGPLIVAPALLVQVMSGSSVVLHLPWLPHQHVNHGTFLGLWQGCNE